MRVCSHENECSLVHVHKGEPILNCNRRISSAPFGLSTGRPDRTFTPRCPNALHKRGVDAHKPPVIHWIGPPRAASVPPEAYQFVTFVLTLAVKELLCLLARIPFSVFVVASNAVCKKCLWVWTYVAGMSWSRAACGAPMFRQRITLGLSPKAIEHHLCIATRVRRALMHSSAPVLCHRASVAAHFTSRSWRWLRRWLWCRVATSSAASGRASDFDA